MKSLFVSVVQVTFILIIIHSCNPEKKERSMISNNKVTWFSIPSDDLTRATNFYHEAFGWQIELLTVEADNTFSFHTTINSKSDKNYIPDERGAINGCIVKREIGLPTPAVLIEVKDIDIAIEKVKKAGGKILTNRISMPSLNGEFVLIKDTEGNYVEVFQGYQ